MAVPVQEGRVLDVMGVHGHQLQCKVLAVLGLAGAELRNVEHGTELARAVVDRCTGAGERNVGSVEMVIQMHGQGLSRADTGADAASAGMVLAPVGAQIQPGLAQAGLEHQVTQKIHRHATRIGQEHHIAQTGDLGVEGLEPVAGDVQQVFHLVLVLAQPGLRQDDGFLLACRVEPVLLHAAQPGVADHLLVTGSRLRAHAVSGHLHDGGNVLVFCAVHGRAPRAKTARHHRAPSANCQPGVFTVFSLWPSDSRRREHKKATRRWPAGECSADQM